MLDLVTWISISGMIEANDLLFACLSIKLPLEAYLVILMWRLFLILMKLEPREYTRNFRTYDRRGPSVCVGGVRWLS